MEKRKYVDALKELDTALGEIQEQEELKEGSQFDDEFGSDDSPVKSPSGVTKPTMSNYPDSYPSNS